MTGRPEPATAGATVIRHRARVTSVRSSAHGACPGGRNPLPVQPRRRLATLIAWLLLATVFPVSARPVIAADQVKCLGAPADEPAGGMYPEPRIFIESQSWWTQTGEAFPGRHIHTGACVPWLQPVDGVVQYHVRNMLVDAPGAITWFRLQIPGNGPDPTLMLPLSRTCSTSVCTAWDSFTVDYTNLLPGRWEHRFTHNIQLNAFGQRQFTTTRWHICVRTCVGGGPDAYTRAVGAAGWYQDLEYANAYLDPDDYSRLRDGIAQGTQAIKVRFPEGAGSVAVDPDAHNGNPGIVLRRVSDNAPIGGFSPVPTGTTWFQATLDTTNLSPGVHKLALRGSNADARGVQEGVLLVPFRVLPTGPQPPGAAFTLSPADGGDAPLGVDVTDTSTGTPTSWSWDFGDGSPPVPGQNPGTHTYTDAGTFTIQLTATNDVGSTQATKTVTVTTPTEPVASFDVTPASGDAPLDVTVTDTSTGRPTSWSWDFGDGGAAVPGRDPGVHRYATPGPYTITLTVTNVTGTSTVDHAINVTTPAPPVADFDVAPNGGDAPLSVSVTDRSTGNPSSWTWDFGDGSTPVTDETPALHTYAAKGSYDLTLTVSNPGGTDAKTVTIVVTNPPPKASFIASPTSGSAPLTVNVADKSTNNPTDWTWEWGDGETARGPTPAAHTYSAPGPYVIKLTVENIDGSTSATVPITVTDPPPPAPVAAFSVSAPSGSAPASVTVSDASTGGPTGWSWTFGDGTSAVIGQTPGPHTYVAAGTYTITLTATNEGGSSSTTRQVTVKPPAPIAAFTANPVTGNAPLSVTVSDRSTNAPTSWQWTFGDGTSSTVQTPPAHVYGTPGTYTITLTATNAGGSSSVPMTITVKPPPPVASFTANPTAGTPPLAVSVTDTSTGSPSTWTWSWGDGTAAVTGRTPAAHTYTTAGTYTITLTATNAGGSTTATRQIAVNPVSTRIKDITFDPTLTDAIHGADRTSGTLTRDTTTVLGSGASARISNAASYVEETVTATDDLYVTFLVRVTGTPSSAVRVIQITNGSTIVGNLMLQTTRRLRLRVGTTTIGSDSGVLALNTTYRVGIHQKRGTGANGTLEAWVAPATSALGNAFARRTTGTWTTAASQIRVGSTNGVSTSLYLDNVLIDRAVLPLTPAP